MSRLYLHCMLCGRRQAEGLLSGRAWGHVELEGGQALRACPTCRARHLDWDERLRLSVQAETSDGSRYGSVYRRAP